ncbi:MAG: GerAB/ArcD/ProY family transporter [Dethiobacteria bacterium]
MTEKISTWQAGTLLGSTIISTAILFPPILVAQEAGRDAWLSFILATVSGALIVLLAVALSSRYPTQNLLGVAESILGRFFGKLLGLAYLFYFICFTAFTAREFAAFMATSFMPHTPILVFSISIILLSTYAVYLGLEVIGRVSEFVFVPIILFLWLLTILIINKIEFTALLPLLEMGPGPVGRGSFIFAGWIGEIFLISMLYPHLVRPRKALQVGLLTLVIVGLTFAVGAVFLEGIFGFQLLSRLTFPILNYVRLISLGGFLERIEALVILIWIAGVYVKISFMNYLSAVSLRQIFGLTEYRSLLLPLAALIAVLSFFLFENILELIRFLKVYWPVFNTLLAAGVPLFLYLLSLLKAAFKTGLKSGG